MNRKKKIVDEIEKELKELARKAWEIWGSVIGMIVVITFFIVVFEFYLKPLEIKFVSQRMRLDEYTLNVLLVGFTALMLLFLANAVFKERKIKQLLINFIKEKIPFSEEWEEEKVRAKKLVRLYNDLKEVQDEIVKWNKKLLEKVEEDSEDTPITVEIVPKELKELKKVNLKDNFI